jgi:hypothetical protein
MIWTMTMRVTLTDSHSACFRLREGQTIHTQGYSYSKLNSGEKCKREKILIIMIQPTRAKCRETNTPASWGLLTVLSGQRDASGTANKVDPPFAMNFLDSLWRRPDVLKQPRFDLLELRRETCLDKLNFFFFKFQVPLLSIFPQENIDEKVVMSDGSWNWWHHSYSTAQGHFSCS